MLLFSTQTCLKMFYVCKRPEKNQICKYSCRTQQYRYNYLYLPFLWLSDVMDGVLFCKALWKINHICRKILRVSLCKQFYLAQRYPKDTFPCQSVFALPSLMFFCFLIETVTFSVTMTHPSIARAKFQVSIKHYPLLTIVK